MWLPISWESNHTSKESHRKYGTISLKSWSLAVIIHMLCYYFKRKVDSKRTDYIWQVRAALTAQQRKTFWFQQDGLCPVVLGGFRGGENILFLCFVSRQYFCGTSPDARHRAGIERDKSSHGGRGWSEVLMMLCLSVMFHPMLWTARKAASSESCTRHCPFDTTALSVMFTPFRYF